jgi:hypothetical protein
MNPCQDFEKRLPAYQEGLISGQDQKDLEDHLRSCVPCRLAFQDLNATRNLLGRLQEVDPPPWFTRKVMARVREEAAGKRGLLRKLFYPLHIKIPLEAVASILVVVLAVYVFKATDPEMPLLTAPSESVPPIPKDFTYREKEKEISPVPAAPTAPITPQNLETKGRLREETEAHQLSGSGALGDKTEEKRPPAAGSPEQPAREIPTGVIESNEEKGKSASDRSMVKQTAVLKSTPIGLTIRVRDALEAAKKALDLLQQAGAKNVQRETQVKIEVITAAVASQAIPKLLDQLNTLGEVQGKMPPSPTQEVPVSIRIEFIPITP